MSSQSSYIIMNVNGTVVPYSTYNPPANQISPNSGNWYYWFYETSTTCSVTVQILSNLPANTPVYFCLVGAGGLAASNLGMTQHNDPNGAGYEEWSDSCPWTSGYPACGGGGGGGTVCNGVILANCGGTTLNVTLGGIGEEIKSEITGDIVIYDGNNQYSNYSGNIKCDYGKNGTEPEHYTPHHNDGECNAPSGGNGGDGGSDTNNSYSSNALNCSFVGGAGGGGGSGSYWTDGSGGVGSGSGNQGTGGKGYNNTSNGADGNGSGIAQSAISSYITTHDSLSFYTAAAGIGGYNSGSYSYQTTTTFLGNSSTTYYTGNTSSVTHGGTSGQMAWVMFYYKIPN